MSSPGNVGNADRAVAIDEAHEQERDDGPTKPDDTAVAATEIGVSRVEAFNKVLYQSGKSRKILLWLLAISIALTMFAYALDQGITTSIFTTMAQRLANTARSPPSPLPARLYGQSVSPSSASWPISPHVPQPTLSSSSFMLWDLPLLQVQALSPPTR
jgi:hypothetical protein